MAITSIISWTAPEHFYIEKRQDWYWAVGIITLTIAGVCFILGSIIPGILVVVSAAALVLHAANPPKIVTHEINDRGVVVDDVLYPFLTLDSFWIPHDEIIPRLIIKSRKTFMPYIVVLIEEVDPESVREVMLKYIAETEHHESIFKHLLEWFGF